MNQLSELIRLLKYTRWNYETNRRETYQETIERALTDYQVMARGQLTPTILSKLRDVMLLKEAFGSMRMLAMAGPAWARSNIVGYNCAALPIESFNALHDLMILGMSGVGVTYSVEQCYISQMPTVKLANDITLSHDIEDTTEGWARALDWTLRMLFAGFDIKLGYAQIRPAGTILRVKGGRASGPEPLMKAMDAIRDIIIQARGRCLTSLEWSDIACWIGEATVRGGVRRTALMAVFDQDDKLMLQAKQGEWYKEYLVRKNANFSQIVNGFTSKCQFTMAMDLMLNGNGEPGFFNRVVAYDRLNWQYKLRKIENELGAVLPNPCGEAVLVPYGLCNLSVVIARSTDTISTLTNKVWAAALMGVLQANATYFPALRCPQWQLNAEILRQCGVCITGFTDSPVMREPTTMQHLYQVAKRTIIDWAHRLDINEPATFTSVKPAGNTSLFTDSSPGVNPRHFRYALRRITLRQDDPIVQVLRESGAPLEDSTWDSSKVYALFPIKAPDGALTLEDITVSEQLNLYLSVLKNYSDQSVSVTINYQEGEQDYIYNWLWHHRDEVTSMTFLKNDGAQYSQMPIERLDKEAYEAMVANFPVIHWERLHEIEQEDYTEGSQEVGCSGGVCSII